MDCFTCVITNSQDNTYPRRIAKFGKTSGRCMWHAWDDDNVWICDICEKPHFYENISWCSESDKLVCVDCGKSKKVKEKFWFWSFYHEIECPFCNKWHATLNRQEHDGEHPWQADPFRCKDFPIWYPGGRILQERDVKKREKPKEKGINCPKCKKKLKITKPGTYRCPFCQTIFRVG